MDRNASWLLSLLTLVALIAAACTDGPTFAASSTAPAEPAVAGATPTSRIEDAAVDARLSSSESVAPSPDATVATRPAAPSAAQTAPTAGVVPSSDISLTQHADDLVVILTISPGRAGQNLVQLFFFDADGDERAISEITVSLSYLDFGSLTLVEKPAEAHLGHAFFSGGQLAHEGRWRVEATFKRTELQDANASFLVLVSPSGDGR